MRTRGWIFAAAVVLAGCGGGGGNPGVCSGSAEVCEGVSPTPTTPVAGTPEGLYKGTTGTGRTAYAVVLPAGEFWILYSQAGNATLLAGAEQGSYTASAGSITSTDVTDISTESSTIARAGTLSGSYVPASNIAGTVVFGSTVATFAANYDSTSRTAATLAEAAGAYTGRAGVRGASEAATLTITTAGVINGSTASGCNVTGTLLPSTGVRSYGVTLSVSGGFCGVEAQSMRGIAVLDGTRIYSAALNGLKDEGFIFAGGR